MTLELRRRSLAASLLSVIVAAGVTIDAAPASAETSEAITHTCTSPYRNFEFIGEYRASLPATLHPGDPVEPLDGGLVATLPATEVRQLRQAGVASVTARFMSIYLISDNGSQQVTHQLLHPYTEQQVPLPDRDVPVSFNVPQTWSGWPLNNGGPAGSRVSVTVQNFFIQLLGLGADHAMWVNLTGFCEPTTHPIIATTTVS